MTSPHTSYNLKVENGTYTVTETVYDAEGKPQEGITTEFTNPEEAEAYMNKQTDDNKTIDSDDIKEINNTQVEGQTEKPASEMTEADAVALNANVHSAADPSSRVVTDGEKSQVKAGLHPDPSEGSPLQQ